MEKLKKARNSVDLELLSALTRYVKEHGVDINNDLRDKFGIDDDENVTKILDVSDSGCYYIMPNYYHNDMLDNICKDNYKDLLRDGFTFISLWALYVVVDDGVERLEAYWFYNSGIKFDEEEAESEHGNVLSQFSTTELCNIIDILIWNEKTF